MNSKIKKFKCLKGIGTLVSKYYYKKYIPTGVYVT